MFFVAPRRVECSRCGVRVEWLPWAEDKHHLTTTYAWFLARWAKRLSWQEVAEAFPHQLGSRLSVVGYGRDLGPGARGADGYPLHRRR